MRLKIAETFLEQAEEIKENQRVMHWFLLLTTLIITVAESQGNFPLI